MDNDFADNIDTRSVSSMVDPKTGKFNEKLDMDVATEADIKRTDDDLLKYLKATGDNVAAKRVDYLVQHQAPDDSGKDKKANPIGKQLLSVNQEILNVLRDIYNNDRTEKAPKIKSSTAIKKSPGLILSEKQGSLGLFTGTSKASPMHRTSLVGSMLERYALPAVSIASTALSTAGSTLAVGAAGLGGWEMGSYLNKKYLTDKSGQGIIGSKIANEYTAYKHAEEFQKEGLMKHNIIGNSEITDWEKVKNLNPWSIQELINVNDWSPRTERKLEAAKTAAEHRLREEHKHITTQGKHYTQYKIKYMHDESVSMTKNPGNFVDLNAANTVNQSTLGSLTGLGEDYAKTFGEKLVITGSGNPVSEKESSFTISGTPENIKKAEALGMFNRHGFSRPTNNISNIHTETTPIRANKVSKRAEALQSVKAEDNKEAPVAKEVLTSKEKKENITNSLSTNLNKQMIIYDAKKEKESKQNILEQTSVNSINMVNKQESESLFGLFSQG